MTLSEIRRALRFSWSERDLDVREVRFNGVLIASYDFNANGPILITLYDRLGHRICNVYYVFLENVLNLVTAHAFILEREEGISHVEHLRILRQFMD